MDKNKVEIKEKELKDNELETVNGGTNSLTSENIRNTRRGDFEFDKDGLYVLSQNKKTTELEAGINIQLKENML